MFNDNLNRKGIPLNEVYTVYIKVRYSTHHFFMLGNQIAFKYSSSPSGSELFDVIHLRLDAYYSNYKIDIKDIVYIHIKFIQLDRKSFDKFKLDYSSINNMKRLEKKEVKPAINIPDDKSLSEKTSINR